MVGFKRSCVMGLVVCMCLGMGIGAAWAQDRSVPKSLMRFAEKDLAAVGKDATIIQAVQLQNASGQSLGDIKKIDQKWQAGDDVSELVGQLSANDATNLLKELQRKHRYILEAFVMDQQGALVALTNKTSDYWQGDEAKFTDSYAGGKGATHTGKVEFDDSAREFVLQISIPVMSGGVAIGAITFGVSVDEWEKR